MSELVAAASSAPPSSAALHSLELSCNAIGDVGVMRVADAVQLF